jgi:hypothetical protein
MNFLTNRFTEALKFATELHAEQLLDTPHTSLYSGYRSASLK